jgi:chloride channel protein, CIC family
MRREGGEQVRDGRTTSLAGLSLIALLVGVLAGGSAVLFRALVASIHNIFFLGEISFYYDPNLHTPASWLGPLVILSPAVGGIAVALIIRRLPADRRGQGVSDIIDAIYYREGRVRTVSAFVKSLAAGIQSGSGGSVGREAAIVQIGAAMASRLSRLLHIAQWQRMTLVAAGAAAGLAAAFNAPLGSIVFAIELMMPEISARTLLPVTIATGASTFVTRFFYGLQPTFLVETVIAAHLRIASVVALVPFAGFGILLGFVSWSMIWLLGWSERQFARISPNPYLQHIIGMLLVGLLGYALLVTTGHYYVAGPSYAALQDILRGDISTFGFFALLFAAKLVATALTLGSGGSGGVFSASLVIGAALGGVVGAAVTALAPSLGVDVTDFAVVGMAGMLGGTTGAAITAIVMVFELTRDYNVIVPMILGVTLALAVRRAVLPESIYTLKLVKKGHEVPDALQANLYRIRHADKAMSTDFTVRQADEPLDEVLTALEETGEPFYLMIAEGIRLKGYLRLDPGFKLWQAREPGTVLGDMARTDFVLARRDDAMFDVSGRLARRGGNIAIVVSGEHRIPRAGDVLGFVALDTMGAAVLDSMRPFASSPGRNPFPALYRRRVVRPMRFWRDKLRGSRSPADRQE